MKALPLAALLLALPLAPRCAAEPTTAELIQQVGEARRNDSVLIRARLTVEDSAAEQRSAIQFRLRGRTDGEVTRRLYQILWPRPKLGQALYLERTGTGPFTGFLFAPPDKVTPLTPELLAGPFLESDLSLEDLSEDFWQWTESTLAGTETVNNEACTIVDLRPPAGQPGRYARIRVWIAPAKALPLRLEKFDAADHLVKRFLFRKPVQRDGLWVPTVTVVQTPGSTRETVIELSRGERDVEIPLTEFTLDGIKEFAARAAQEAEQAPPARRGGK